MKIRHQSIGAGHRPYIIAELSGNHNGSLERALSLVKAAAEAGVSAVKLQTYTADTLTLDVREGEFVVSDPKSLWKGRTLHDLYNEASTPWEWHGPIRDRCLELGVECFSTPFDETAVDFLESLDFPAYKISSFECTHLPLLRKVAATGKPVIMSTGMAEVAEIGEAVLTLKKNGCREFALLKCTNAYPSLAKDIHLKTLPHLRDLFGCEVGLSDHTMGIGVAIAAVAQGATIIEKHFTLDRADGGVDSAFSMEPAEMAALVRESEKAGEALGGIHYGPTESEKIAVTRRRSIYIAQDVAEGEILTTENLRIVRPGLGLEPRYFEHVLGRSMRRAARKGTPLSWDLVIGEKSTSVPSEGQA